MPALLHMGTQLTSMHTVVNASTERKEAEARERQRQREAAREEELRQRRLAEQAAAEQVGERELVMEVGPCRGPCSLHQHPLQCLMNM